MKESKKPTQSSPEPEKQDNSQTIESWLSKVERARKERETRASKYRWREVIEEFKGKWPLEMQGYDISIMPINLVFAYVKTELPSLYIRDPHIKVNPKNRTSIWTSKVLEAALNYIWMRKKMKREIKKCITDSLLIGHSWFKSGYTGTFGTIEDNGQTIETIESEDFFGYRIPWDCITFDPDAIDPPYDCSWIAHDVWLLPEDVKDNPKYDKTVASSLAVSFDDKESTTDHNKEHRVGKIRVTEVWNMKKKQVFTIAAGCQDFLEAPKSWPYEMKGYPFSYLKFNFANDDPWGLSDPMMAEGQFLEKIKVRSTQLDHLKRFNRQVFAEVDAFASVEEESKFALGITGSVVKLNQGKIGAIQLTNPASLNPDMYNVEDRLDNDAANVLGQTAVERGGQAKTSTRTKSELNQQVSGAENRRTEKVGTVEDFVEDIADNQVALIKQFATEPYYVRILGQNSPEMQQAIQERPSAQKDSSVTNQGGFTFTAEDVAGEFDIEVVSGSSTPLDRAEKTKTLMQVLELLPQTGATPGGPIYGAVARMIAEEFDMPELLMAIEEEVKVQQQQQQKQAQDAQDTKDMQTAQAATETQIKAEQAAAKHNKVMVDFLKAQNESKKPDTPKESINFGDLPAEGKVQMAAQAGISLVQPIPEEPDPGVGQ